MNKQLNRMTLLGILFVSIAGTLLHFVYEWTGSNAIVGLFAPINESTWEHLKLLFFPMLAFSLFEAWLLKDKYPNLLGSSAVGIFAGLILIPLIFYGYTWILGKNNTVIDIAIFYFSVIAAFLIQRYLTLHDSPIRQKKWISWLLLPVILGFFIVSLM